MEAPVRPHRRLVWKYTALVVALVAAAIVSVGLTELYFSYQDSKEALSQVEQDKASSAAASIEQTMQDLVRELEALAQPTVGKGAAGLAERNQDFHRLFARARLVSELSYLDSLGKERVRTSPLELDRIDSGIDLSASPAYTGALAGQRYFGPVYFERGSQPHMRIAVAEPTARGGVVVAVIDLSFVRQVIDRARVGTAGYAYAVDPRGVLITHPDVDLVLRRTSLAILPQVEAALAAPPETTVDASATVGRDPEGTRVLSAYETIESLGWHVFVEEPLSEAFAPIEAAIWRTAFLLVAFLLLATATSVLLARRLVRPIESIHAAAAKIGSGALYERIEIASHDELGALAEEFNRMAAQLQESYAGLELKVDERTQELATALADLDEKSRELEAASTHKSEFLASMSHELRTPLNAIIGFSQVLREELFGSVNEKQAEYLDDILASGNHLLSLINDVLDLSKVEAGRIALEVAPFSLEEALERGVVMVRERATRDGVRVVLEPVEVGEVTGDERRIRQVIFNLLSNAVKFTPPGGEVDVSAVRVNGEVRVAVTDTGPGIAPQDRDRIFEEFQQTEAGIDQREGTGLGLALSKRLVELHGGRIWVDSEPGVGSTFVFTLPTKAGDR